MPSPPFFQLKSSQSAIKLASHSSHALSHVDANRWDRNDRKFGLIYRSASPFLRGKNSKPSSRSREGVTSSKYPVIPSRICPHHGKSGVLRKSPGCRGNNNHRHRRYIIAFQTCKCEDLTEAKNRRWHDLMPSSRRIANGPNMYQRSSVYSNNMFPS
jgi:hypothetical protein